MLLAVEDAKTARVEIRTILDQMKTLLSGDIVTELQTIQANLEADSTSDSETETEEPTTEEEQ